MTSRPPSAAFPTLFLSRSALRTCAYRHFEHVLIIYITWIVYTLYSIVVYTSIAFDSRRYKTVYQTHDPDRQS